MVGILNLRKILILPAPEAEEEPSFSSPQSQTKSQLQEAEGYTTVMWITLTALESTVQNIHENH